MRRDGFTGRRADRVILDEAESIARLAGISAPEVPLGTVTGFDVSSGPDQTAKATIRVSKDYGFTVENIEFIDPPPSAFAQMQEFARRQQDELFKAMMGDKSWWHHQDDPASPEPMNGHEFHPVTWCCKHCRINVATVKRGLAPACGTEIIVGEDDQRGLSARPVRGRVVA